MPEATSRVFDVRLVRSLDVEEAVKSWAERVGVTGISLQRYLLALGELSDSLSLLARTLEVDGQLVIRIEPFTSWIVTEFQFPVKIPLDPHFDVQDEELGGFPGLIVQPDIFWRRLILKWVDKAQWSRDGNTVTIALTQYARRPSSPGELYFLGLSPRRISGLELRPAERGLTLALAPNLKTAFRLDEQTRFLLEEADGKTPVREIYSVYVRRFGPVHPSVLGELVEDCVHKGLLTAGAPLIQQSKKSSRTWVSRVAGLQFPVSKPDTVFATLDHWFGWIWSRISVSLMFLFVASTLFLFGVHVIPGFSLQTALHIENIPLNLIPWFILGAYAAITIHEIAHGAACKKLGGRVSEFGIMFYLGLLSAYVDTTDAWMFPQRARRILVSFAGPLSTLFMGCIFLWGQNVAKQHGAIGAFMVLGPLAFISLELAALNLLPLLEFDGYYILVDLLDHPNLKRKAALYWSTLLRMQRRKKNLELSRNDQLLYLIYGSSSVILVFLLLAFPIVEGFPSLSAGRVTADAGLSILAILLFFCQAIAQNGGRWFSLRRQRTIDLKGGPSV